MTSDEFRAAFSDGYRRIFDRAIDLLMRAERFEEAFETAERGRARALLDLCDARRGGGPEPPAARAQAGDLQASLREDDTLLSYWVTREATFAWLHRSGAPTRAARLAVGRAALAKLVAQVSSSSISAQAPLALARRGGGAARAAFDNDPRPLLKQLHDQLLGPFATSLPRKAGARLVLVPDGPLLALSFAELVVREGRYLIEDYSLQYAPSVALLRPRPPRGAPAAGSALLVGLASGYPKASGETLAPLPGARREVEAVARRFPRSATTLLLDDAASEEKVRAALSGSAVVHLATHGVLSDRNPADSFVALRAGGGHDGRLTAGEIIGLSLGADLVVLSTCRGASGQVTGEGVLGLSRALLAAGVRSLVAATDELPDETAAGLLPRFYTAWMAGADPPAALRTAQLERLRLLRAGQVSIDTPFGPVALPEHPALWAGLLVIGQR